ncbi:hypothetical protein GA0061102_103580 [Rhizobium miluonense]|uniref:Uncharacterized protein n=1 Tax=Rhizobium miluonense TaxID=411945 RepID=A0A1C3WPK7_9HYPH|nr:hypothetical protein GA0061102_103580 [Rhizobium miluonense]
MLHYTGSDAYRVFLLAAGPEDCKIFASDLPPHKIADRRAGQAEARIAVGGIFQDEQLRENMADRRRLYQTAQGRIRIASDLLPVSKYFGARFLVHGTSVSQYSSIPGAFFALT